MTLELNVILWYGVEYYCYRMCLYYIYIYDTYVKLTCGSINM